METVGAWLSTLTVRVDEVKVRKYHEHYRAHGQFLPYQPSDIGK